MEKCNYCKGNGFLWAPPDTVVACSSCGGSGNAEVKTTKDMRIGKISQLFYPHSGFCYQCKTVWKIVKWHNTSFDPNQGCFPLCQQCWEELTPETRLPYYQQMWNEWKSMGKGKLDESIWPAIEAAVLAGG